jgi:hypothetical protein
MDYVNIGGLRHEFHEPTVARIEIFGGNIKKLIKRKAPHKM